MTTSRHTTCTAEQRAEIESAVAYADMWLASLYGNADNDIEGDVTGEMKDAVAEAMGKQAKAVRTLKAGALNWLDAADRAEAALDAKLRDRAEAAEALLTAARELDGFLVFYAGTGGQLGVLHDNLTRALAGTPAPPPQPSALDAALAKLGEKVRALEGARQRSNDYYKKRQGYSVPPDLDEAVLAGNCHAANLAVVDAARGVVTAMGEGAPEPTYRHPEAEANDKDGG